MNGTATSYSYGPYNKLLSAGSTTYSYDNNGNMISKTSGSNSWAYKYDYQNRLNQVLLNGLSVFQATYDGDGRRVQTVAGTDTTIYHYQAGSWDPIYAKGLTTGIVTDIIFVGSFRVGKIQGGVNYYYHLDRLGSVRFVTQTANLQTFTAKYLPYGAPYATSGSENFQYTGKQLDVPTGLYYYGYRYLDSQSGRFITPDIQQPNTLNPQTLNRYTYANNNPISFLDPNGLQAWMEAWELFNEFYHMIEPFIQEGLRIGAEYTYGTLEEGEKNAAIGASHTALEIEIDIEASMQEQVEINRGYVHGLHGGHLTAKIMFLGDAQADSLRIQELERAAAIERIAEAHLKLGMEIDKELAGVDKYGFGEQPTTVHGGHLVAKMLFEGY